MPWTHAAPPPGKPLHSLHTANLATKIERRRTTPRRGPATSGIVLFAKTPQAASTLSAMWNTPKIQKIYRALAQNIARHDVYEIVTPIGLVPHPLIGSVWAANPSGKPSRSLAKVISRSVGNTRTTSTTT